VHNHACCVKIRQCDTFISVRYLITVYDCVYVVFYLAN